MTSARATARAASRRSNSSRLTTLRRDQLFCPVELGLGQLQRGLALVEIGNPGVQESDLVVDVLYGVLELPALAPRLGLETAHRRGRRHQIRRAVIHRRLLHGDGEPERLLVQLDEKVALAHTIVVVHQHPEHLARHPGRDEGDMAVHKGVVRRNGVQGLLNPGNAEDQGGQQNQAADCAQQQPPPLYGMGIFCGRFRRRIPRGASIRRAGMRRPPQFQSFR